VIAVDTSDDHPGIRGHRRERGQMPLFSGNDQSERILLKVMSEVMVYPL
jgi:hypothetical protein